MLLNDILLKAEAVIVEDLRGPTIDIKPGEIVIGTLPKNLRGLWFVMHQAEGRYNELCHALEATAQAKSMPEYARQCLERDRDDAILEVKIIFAILMFEIGVAFKGHAYTLDFALRANWTIVRDPTMIQAAAAALAEEITSSTSSEKDEGSGDAANMN